MKKLTLYILSLGFLSSCEKMSNYDTPNLEELSAEQKAQAEAFTCLLHTSPSPRD